MTAVAPLQVRRVLGMLMWFFWRANRAAFLGVAFVWLAFAVLAQIFRPFFRASDESMVWIHIPFGLSLFFIFGYSHFTDSNRRERLVAFPAHLFTLPAATRWLATGPMLGGIVVALAAYFAWALGVYWPLGVPLPLGWPCLYLGVMMVCFQAAIWTLAEHRLLRLAALGIGGTLMPIAWNLFREDAGEALADFELLGIRLSVAHTSLLFAWAGMGVIAYGATVAALGRQRNGRRAKKFDFLAAAEEAVRLITPRAKEFDGGAEALGWAEWRRQGCILPLITGLILALVFVFSMLYRPVPFERAAFVLGWALAAPLGLSWTMSQGFGKIGPWSKESQFLPFYAIRPVADGDWIVIKMQVAMKGVLLAWALTVALVPLWLGTTCEYGPILTFFRVISLHDSLLHFTVIAALAALAILLFSWRLLVGNLYVGLSGNWVLMNASVGAMLGSGLGILFLLVWWSSRSHSPQEWFDWPGWIPWALGAVFAAKAAATLGFTWWGLRVGSISLKRVALYSLIWLLGTMVFLELAWMLFPSSGVFSRSLSALALFCMPMLRLSLAPLAITANRRGGWRFLTAGLSGTVPPETHPPRSARVSLGAIALALVAFLMGALFTNQMRHWREPVQPVPETHSTVAVPAARETLPPTDAGAGRTDEDQLEIARLRGKVAELKIQLDESKQHPARVAILAGSNTSPAAAVPAKQPLASYPSSGWEDAGFDTAYGALQTHWWAIRSGDIAKFKASVQISDSLRATLDKTFPEELRFGRSIEEGLMLPAQAQDRYRGFDSYNVVGEKVISDQEIDLEVQTIFKSGDSETGTWKFIKVNGQWRQLIDEEFVGLPKPGG